MLYLIQVTIYTALMYSIYLLLLKDRTAHMWSRFYLLLCVVLPLILPFLKMVMPPIVVSKNAAANAIIMPVVTVGARTSNLATNNAFVHEIASIIYLIVTTLLFLKLSWEYVRLRNFLKSSDHYKLDGINVLLNTGYMPGSWGKSIFLPDKDVNELIIKHELIHIKQGHSYDILLVRLLQCFLWPNVLLYVIEKELKIVHEYLADAGAAQEKDEYTRLLLDEIFITNQFSLSNNFFRNPIARRLAMLYKGRQKATGNILISIALGLCFIAGAVYLQSCSKRDTADVKRLPVINDSAIATSMLKYNIEKVLMPVSRLYTSLKGTVIYPEYAKQKHLGGCVMVAYTIEGGKIKHPVIKSSPDTSLSRAVLEAMQKVSMAGGFNDIPGKVTCVTPVDFDLNEDNKARNSKKKIDGDYTMQTANSYLHIERIKK